MKTMRRVIMILLLLALSVGTLVACGSKDEEKESEKKPKIEKGSLQEMLDAMQKTEEGTLHFEFSMDSNYTVINTKRNTFIAGDVVYNRSKNELMLTIQFANTVNGEKSGLDSIDVLSVKNNKLYINLGIIDEYAKTSGRTVEGLTNLDGWFAIPLPSDLPKYKAPGDDDLIGAIVAELFRELPQESVDGSFKASLKSKDDYVTFLTALRDFMKNKGKSLIEKGYANGNVLTEIDVNKYVGELIDYYEDAVREVVREYGEQMDITESQFDELLREAKNQDFNKLLEQYMESEGSVELFKKPTNEEIDAEIDEYVNQMNELLKAVSEQGDQYPPVEIRVEADDTGYTAELSLDSKTETMNNAVKLSIRLDPGKGTVKVPDKEVTVKNIADTVFSSYMSYVDKSRMMTDISVVSDMMMAAERVAIDPEVSAPVGEQFIVTVENGEVTISAFDPYGDKKVSEAATELWKDLVFYGDDYYEAKSDTLQKASGEFIGMLEADGSLTWKMADSDGSLRKFAEFSEDFMVKYGLK